MPHKEDLFGMLQLLFVVVVVVLVMCSEIILHDNVNVTPSFHF